MNIYLIGFRCSGKSTLGKVLARLMAREFVDMDDALVEEAGRTIAQMVADKGWPYFREQEHALLDRLADRDKLVVATGGGIILDPANVTLMRRSGKVVWLQCSSETIGRRMQADPRTGDMRPALTDKSLNEEIQSTLQVREPLYREAAHMTIAGDQGEVKSLAEEIQEKLKGSF